MIFQSKAERIVLVENPGPFLVYLFIRTEQFGGEAVVLRIILFIHFYEYIHS